MSDPRLGHQRANRRGLSIMEVLFAIGVLMVGLLGIAAVLPVGTRNAAGALRSDATASAIENQVSGAMGRLGGRPKEFDFPVPSLRSFNNGFGSASGLSAQDLIGERNELFLRRSVLEAASIGPTNDPVLSPPNNAAPAAAPAFCIDPAFLAAASNLRNDSGGPGSRPLNSYDRTKFPCFDVNYHPAHHPGEAMASGSGWPMTPRMYRVSLNTNDALASPPTSAIAKALLSERDGLPLTKPKDNTLAPGLLFSEIGDATRLDVQRSGAFSSIVMIVPTNAASTNYEVSVVVFEGRQTTTNTLGLDTTNPAEVFPLLPFGSSLAWPAQASAPPNSKTYSEEVMGVVTAVPGVTADIIGTINGGVGQFSFVQSAACNPETKVGQWLMLARWDSAAGVNRYGWYRISDVLFGPAPTTYDGQSVYATTVEVRGADWLLHPGMVTAGGAIGPYPALTTAAMRRQATIVIKVPKVVSVRTMTL